MSNRTAADVFVSDCCVGEWIRFSACPAMAFGLRAFRVEQPQDLRDRIGEALAHRGPVLVEAVVDPDEPLLPGKMKPEQAEHYAEAL